jgi:sugar lactone lactonase YvrE
MSGFSGDGGLAGSAQVSFVLGLAVDTAGNLWVGDSGNNRIRQITADGIITTVAGDGSCGFSGDGRPAATAQLCGPAGMAIDRAGNLFVTDTGNNRIRKISPDRKIATVAGIGPETGIASSFSAVPASGDGGPATSAGVWLPSNVAVDGAGNLFIADTTYTADGTYQGQVVRKVSADGVITTVTGQGCPEAVLVTDLCYDGTTAAKTWLPGPLALAVDSADNRLLIAGSGNRIRKLLSDGTLATVAGDGTTHLYSGDGGPATSAQLCAQGVAVDGTGNLFIADYCNDRIRKVTRDGIITTVAGNGTWGSSGDGGAATSAQVVPFGVAADGAGNLFVFDVSNQSIRKISPDGIITTVITVGGNNEYVAVDSAGDLFIACPANTVHAICEVSPDGTIRTVTAQLAYPLGVAVSGAGNLFVADAGSNRIRKVAPDGTITTIAGNGTKGFSGDGGPATEAQLEPQGVAVDGTGNLFIADFVNNRIRKVSPDGIITTIAGDGSPGYSGDGGAATDASIGAPFSVAADSAGNVYFTTNNAIRVLRPVNKPIDRP